MRRTLAIPLLVLAAAAPAAAQDEAADPSADVVVLSVGGDASEADARVVREAVAAALAADGLEVLEEGDVALRIPPARLRACGDTRCAFGLARELGAPMAAAVATWDGDDGPGSVTLSLVVGPERSHTATEEVGEGGVASAARAAVAAAQASRRRALLVEGTRRPEPSPDPETDPRAEAAAEEPSPLSRERSLEEWILPSLLGVVGLALVGVSVYAMLDEQCDLRGASGVCLRGSAPNYGVGVLLSVVGGLSIAGAVLWLVVGGQPPEMGDVEVVIGPDGGALSWRGRF
ncbi:MAG TPA: hypothetical protein RMH99_30020 [Sandaracinaceae bacterium LLY-WYZ-13_1]|nr:hypothetical protein [Sandaracinaceae bacterium LLY-WYZ-13_1]